MTLKHLLNFMAVSKDKVKAALDTKYKGKSVSKDFKEKMADKWAEKIETEDDIATHIEDNDYIFQIHIADSDKRVTNAVNKTKLEIGETISGKGPKKEEEKSDEDDVADDPATPAYVKALMKQNASLLSRIEGIEKASTTKTIEQQFRADERLKGVPEFLLKRAIPKTAEELEDAVTGLATDFAAYAKEQKITIAGGDTPPGGGGNDGKGGDVKEATKEELDSVMANLSI